MSSFAFAVMVSRYHPDGLDQSDVTVAAIVPYRTTRRGEEPDLYFDGEVTGLLEAAGIDTTALCESSEAFFLPDDDTMTPGAFRTLLLGLGLVESPPLLEHHLDSNDELRAPKHRRGAK